MCICYCSSLVRSVMTCTSKQKQTKKLIDERITNHGLFVSDALYNIFSAVFILIILSSISYEKICVGNKTTD